MNDLESRCAAALEALARKEFAQWRGLPDSCTLDEVARRFPREDDWVGVDRLGEARREHRYTYVSADGYPQQARVWLRDERVTLIDVQDPELPGGLQSLLEQLGSPDAKLNSYLGVLELEESEWVYAARGLTLFINPENGLLLRLAVFPPTSVEQYRRELRLDLQIRPVPYRGKP